MLTALELGNFKAFAETQRIPIRPLTLIYGANSAGKSSVIHSMILANHAMQTGELDVHRTLLGGESVDLGGFRQYVHRREGSRRVEWAIDLDTQDFEGRLAEFFAPAKVVSVFLEFGLAHKEQTRKRPGVDPRTGQPIEIEEPTGELVPTGSPAIQTFSIHADKAPLLRMSRRPTGRLRLDRMAHDHPVFRTAIKAMVEVSTTTESLRPQDYDGLNEAVAELIPEIEATTSGFLPDGLAQSHGLSPSLHRDLFFAISRGRRREDLAAAIRAFLPRKLAELLKDISTAVDNEIGRLHYLGPLRSYPPRHLAYDQHSDPNWHAGGGYAWDLIRRDQHVRTLVNQWLSSPYRLQTPYELTVRRMISPVASYSNIWDSLEDIYAELTTTVDPSDLDIPVETLIEDTLDDLDGNYTELDTWNPDTFVEIITHHLLMQSSSDTIDELILLDTRSNTIVSHRDVGIGISQILPVLVAMYATHNRLIAVEQPEIHLHPKLQAELGDVFIESALGERGNTLLLETHSEHILLRIMKRMRQSVQGGLPEGLPQVLPKDVSVLYVEPDGKRSIIREMPLNERGELVKAWPGGFFEEGLREVF